MASRKTKRPTRNITLDMHWEDDAPVVLTCHRMSLLTIARELQSLPGIAPALDGVAEAASGEAEIDVAELEKTRAAALVIVPLATSVDGVRPAFGEGAPLDIADLSDPDLLAAFGTILVLSGFGPGRAAFRYANSGGMGDGVGGGGAGEAAAQPLAPDGDSGGGESGAHAGGPDAGDDGATVPPVEPGASAAHDG